MKKEEEKKHGSFDTFFKTFFSFKITLSLFDPQLFFFFSSLTTLYIFAR